MSDLEENAEMPSHFEGIDPENLTESQMQQLMAMHEQGLLGDASQMEGQGEFDDQHEYEEGEGEDIDEENDVNEEEEYEDNSQEQQ